MNGKKVEESSVVMAQVMLPGDANPAGNVHGGAVMKLIDTTAGVVASRHARSNVVTACIDRLIFHNPVFVGDLIYVKGSINFVGRSSMEVGIRVEAENLLTGELRHTASAYLTLVALDTVGKPRRVPPLIIEGDEQFRRNCEAKIRRESRLAERKREESCSE